jgi:Rieske Fe-S protein
VLSARSTEHGCTVVFNPNLGSSRDIPNYLGATAPGGRLFDPCHQGQWDAFHRAAPLPGTPAPARLAGLDVRVVGDRMEATAFDGPVGPQPH